MSHVRVLNLTRRCINYCFIADIQLIFITYMHPYPGTTPFHMYKWTQVYCVRISLIVKLDIT